MEESQYSRPDIVIQQDRVSIGMRPNTSKGKGNASANAIAIAIAITLNTYYTPNDDHY